MLDLSHSVIGYLLKRSQIIGNLLSSNFQYMHNISSTSNSYIGLQIAACVAASIFVHIHIYQYILTYSIMQTVRSIPRCLVERFACISHASHSTRKVVCATCGARDAYYFSGSLCLKKMYTTIYASYRLMILNADFN